MVVWEKTPVASLPVFFSEVLCFDTFTGLLAFVSNNLSILYVEPKQSSLLVIL